MALIKTKKAAVGVDGNYWRIIAVETHYGGPNQLWPSKHAKPVTYVHLAQFVNKAARNDGAMSLDTVRLAMKATEVRLRELASERKPLLDEAEFYTGRQIPPRLKQQLDANDAGVAAQRQSAANPELELARINRLYDAELDRLRRLWAGALPGSLPPAEVAVSPAASSAKR